MLLSDNLVVNDRVHFNANDKLSKYRFRKGFNTQQGLLKILMKIYLIQEESLVRCLSKALEVSVMTKLNAYGFTLSTLRLIYDYFSNRKQKKTKRNTQLETRIVVALKLYLERLKLRY